MGRHVLASCTALLAAGALLLAQPAQDSGSRRAGVIAVTSRDTAQLRAWDATVDGMARSGELSLTRTRTDTLIAGRSHQRYDQYVHGIRVVGGEITRQLSRNVTTSIFGQILSVTGVPDRPTLSEDDARAVFEGLATRGVPGNRPIELVILPTENGQYALAYSTHVWTSAGWMQTYIDAEDGRVLFQYNDLQRQSAVGTGTGVLGDTKKVSVTSQSGRFVANDALRPPVLVTYNMQGNYVKTTLLINGLYVPTAADIATDTDNVWTDGANVDGHTYLGYTYDYYFKRFGRRGLDDRDVPIYGVTHPANRSDVFSLYDTFPEYFDNAFFCPFCGAHGESFMVFGEGFPPTLTPGGRQVDFLAGGLDVVAHELTHGITDYSSGLIYLNESGALNESFSDMMGTSVEFFFQPPGGNVRQADYLIGEDVVRPGGIRSMSNPAAYGDPDHYSRRFTGPADNGGVHTNSAIPNQAFYLAIEGGTNRTSGLSVQGVGGANRDQIEKVFYRAFTLMLPANATFSTARAATIQASRDLYGANSAAERAVTQAWTAVGVN